MTLSVTPKTSMAITDPAVGMVSTIEVVVPPDLGKFIKPDKTVRTWSQAYAYCTSLGTGARLPTRDELVNLFLSATTATAAATAIDQVNSDMCSVHGWPLLRDCGGSDHSYWSGTPNGVGGYYYVNLNSGYFPGTLYSGTAQVACIR
jgi:hypothetical protein